MFSASAESDGPSLFFTVNLVYVVHRGHIED